MTAVRLENLTLSYDRHPAVHHLSGEFRTGSLTAIAGPNGAGKSTLLKGIAGILTPEEGRVMLDASCAGSIAYLPQVTEMQRDFPLSVEHMVAIGGWQHSGAFGALTEVQRNRAREALEVVGLKGFEARSLDSLSAGQFQRALFARLLLQDAKLILLDEPFNAMDADTTLRLISIIRRWHEESRTVICVLHDFHQIRDIFPECLLLARECVAWGASKDTLHPEHLMRARVFQPAYPDHAHACEQPA